MQTFKLIIGGEPLAQLILLIMALFYQVMQHNDTITYGCGV